MQTIEQYIKSKLGELKKVLIQLSYRYAYDSKTDFHIVEIEPYSIIEDNDIVFDILDEMQTEVYDTYPECNLVYSEESSCNDMSNLLDEYKHNCFQLGDESITFGQPLAEFNSGNNYSLAA